MSRRDHQKRSRFHITGPTEEGSISAEIVLTEDEFAAKMDDVAQTAERFDPGGEFRADVMAIVEHMLSARDDACLEAADHLHRVALDQTPIESGNLKDMSYADLTDNGAEVVYPGPYAKYQHYNLQFHHPRGGNALYLELPLHTEKEVMLEKMAEVLRPYLEG